MSNAQALRSDPADCQRGENRWVHHPTRREEQLLEFTSTSKYHLPPTTRVSTRKLQGPWAEDLELTSRRLAEHELLNGCTVEFVVARHRFLCWYNLAFKASSSFRARFESIGEESLSPRLPSVHAQVSGSWKLERVRYQSSSSIGCFVALGVCTIRRQISLAGACLSEEMPITLLSDAGRLGVSTSFWSDIQKGESSFPMRRSRNRTMLLVPNLRTGNLSWNRLRRSSGRCCGHNFLASLAANRR
mmetsp:Transcript_15417/g.37901  ORF Transcript_15417/g.37901 Transcript_15417/m.37901 type:complete len:245 (-) Transcript_15417:997-1731(-)